MGVHRGYVKLLPYGFAGIMEKSGENSCGDLSFIKNIGGFDFGEGIRFEPSKLIPKFQRQADEMNLFCFKATTPFWMQKAPACFGQYFYFSFSGFFFFFSLSLIRLLPVACILQSLIL